MKKITLFITGLFLAGTMMTAIASNDKKSSNSAVNTTTSLKGKVIDGNSGEGLPGVCIKVKGTSRTAYTDFDGNFNFNGLKPGNYELTTSLISYEKEKMKVDLNASTANELQLLMKTINE